MASQSLGHRGVVRGSRGPEQREPVRPRQHAPGHPFHRLQDQAIQRRGALAAADDQNHHPVGGQLERGARQGPVQARRRAHGIARHPHAAPGAPGQPRRGLRERQVHLTRPHAEEARGDAGHGVLLLDGQRDPQNPRRDPGRSPGIAAGHHHQLRTKRAKEVEGPDDGRAEGRERPEAHQALASLEALHGKERVLHATRRQDTRFDASRRTDEEDPCVRSGCRKSVRQGERRIEMPSGSTAGEDDHGALGALGAHGAQGTRGARGARGTRRLMHGPPSCRAWPVPPT